MSKSNLLRFSLLVLLFVCVGCTKTMGLDEMFEVEADNIKIKVLDFEDVTVDDGELSIANGDYTKVKVSIENIGDSKYSWTILNFSLGDEEVALNTLGLEDALPLEVEDGETITGYVYFSKTNASKLTYVSNNGKKKVKFKLKK